MRIQSAVFYKSYTGFLHMPETTLPECAFIGRSNVGKSSLINMLTGKKGLAKTSNTPGKTRLINYFLINRKWGLIDLPGYGYAKVSKEGLTLEQMIVDYILNRAGLTHLFLLIDSRLEPQKSDLEFTDFLGEHRVPFSLVFTKSDKISSSTLNRNINLFKQTLKESWEVLPPLFISSSHTGKGRKEILKYIGEFVTAQVDSL